MLIRKIAAIAVATSLTLGATGCTFYSPVATQASYQPGNGANANVGNVALRNLVYLSANGQGVLIGSAVATDANGANITLATNGTNVPLSLAVGQKLDFGYNNTNPLTFGVAPKAGTNLVLQVTNGSATADVVVPVLDGTFSEYADLVPTPAKTN